MLQYTTKIILVSLLSEILGALKKEMAPIISRSLNMASSIWPHQYSVTCVLNGKADSNVATLTTATSIVYYSRSQLYTVAMVFYKQHVSDLMSCGSLV